MVGLQREIQGDAAREYDAAMKKLTRKQAAFVREYLVDLNATQAAIRAGYSKKTAYSIGAENMSKPEIQAALGIASARRAKKTEITAERVLREYAKLAFYDPKKLYDHNDQLKSIADIDDDTAAAITSLDHISLPDSAGGGSLQKVRMADKKAALDSIAKHLGMFIERHELTGPGGAGLSIQFGLTRPERDDLQLQQGQGLLEEGQDD